MNDLMLFITLLCMNELVFILLYFMLFGDTLFDTESFQTLKKVKKNRRREFSYLSESDLELLIKFFSTFTDSELTQLNKIIVKLELFEDHMPGKRQKP
jgi:Mg2+ and Co2+ transporter CorA